MGEAKGVAGEVDHAAVFAARKQRVADVIALRAPDRIPINLQMSSWAAHQGGLSHRQAMYDVDRVCEVVRRHIVELQPDLYQVPLAPAYYGPTLDALDFNALRWPGHGVPDDVTYQYIDQEFMRADEYDAYLFDPTGFHLRTYLPRIASALAGFTEFPILPALVSTHLSSASIPFAEPAMRRAFASLAEAGVNTKAMLVKLRKFNEEMAALGFPSFGGAFAEAPFDQLADYMRGSKGAMLDMRRQPDKLLAVLDKIKVFTIRQALHAGATRPGGHVFMPLHWGLDGFMSPDQFRRFYWPTLREVILALIDAGLVPMVFWESDCTSRLEIIADIPPGRAIYKFERTNMFRAKEVLGQIVCLRGNVPVSLLSTSTAAEVDAYCRRLIGAVGKGGGLILDTSSHIPDRTPRANVEAMIAAVHRYGC